MLIQNFFSSYNTHKIADNTRIRELRKKQHRTSRERHPTMRIPVLARAQRYVDVNHEQVVDGKFKSILVDGAIRCIIEV